MFLGVDSLLYILHVSRFRERLLFSTFVSSFFSVSLLHIIANTLALPSKTSHVIFRTSSGMPNAGDGSVRVSLSLDDVKEQVCLGQGS